MKAISVEQMRELDRRTIEKAGIPGKELMLRAGTGAAIEIVEFVDKLSAVHTQRAIILTGKGNNGGDGYVVAKFLYDHSDLEVEVVSTCKKKELSGDAKYYADILPELIPFKVINKKDDDIVFKRGDIIIDALLGTGISGPLKTPYDRIINNVNNSGYPVIALDIPSGLNGNTGTFEQESIIADMTITMGMPKVGMFKEKGPDYCGQLRCIDIGIPQNYIDEIDSTLDITFEKDIRSKFTRLSPSSHKGSMGKVTVIGGSRLYKGAPLLSGKAALKSGSGLVTVALPSSAGNLLLNENSLIIKEVNDSGQGVFSYHSVNEIADLAAAADSVVFGPGLSINESILAIIEYINEIKIPVVYDADALNIIAMYTDPFTRDSMTVLTPHPGEMKRLLKGFGLSKYVDSDRITQAVELAKKTSTCVVLKGKNSVIASDEGRVTINSSGSPALSTAGSGDVLAGMIGTFLAQGHSTFESAQMAVFIHGLAGEMSPFGKRGMTADNLLNLIPEAMKEVTPFA